MPGVINGGNITASCAHAASKREGMKHGPADTSRSVMCKALYFFSAVLRKAWFSYLSPVRHRLPQLLAEADGEFIASVPDVVPVDGETTLAGRIS